jgi:hypothetical protein
VKPLGSLVIVGMELGWRRTGTPIMNQGTGETEFFAGFVNRYINQHRNFMRKEHPKVGPIKTVCLMNNRMVVLDEIYSG